MRQADCLGDSIEKTVRFMAHNVSTHLRKDERRVVFFENFRMVYPSLAFQRIGQGVSLHARSVCHERKREVQTLLHEN